MLLHVPVEFNAVEKVHRRIAVEKVHRRIAVEKVHRHIAVEIVMLLKK